MFLAVKNRPNLLKNHANSAVSSTQLPHVGFDSDKSLFCIKKIFLKRILCLFKFDSIFRWKLNFEITIVLLPRRESNFCTQEVHALVLDLKPVPNTFQKRLKVSPCRGLRRVLASVMRVTMR